ncbi:ABC transporter permease [Singulisphaera rosea]
MNPRGGLRFGLGPVFAYEWIIASRRWQGYALRSGFAGMLLVALLVIVANPAIPRSGTVSRDLAKLGESFFFAVIGTQLTLVLIAAPAATAGALCLDRASGTLTYLLMTDLTDSEIVLGKLASRLFPVLGLVAAAVPMMTILSLLGGVDPNALLGAFLVSVGIAVLGCALALMFSLVSKKTHEALLATYAVWGIWLVSRSFVNLVNGAFGWSLAVVPAIADPYYLTFAPYWSPGRVSIYDDLWFLAVALMVATVVVIVAILRLRSVCTRTKVARTPSVLDRLCRRLDPNPHLPAPSLDFNPVLWREWHRARPSRAGRIVASVFVLGALIASVGAIVSPASTFAKAWVNGLQVAIGLLLLSVTAATSLAEERTRGSLDVLMTTRLSTREIVLGKWLGTYRVVPWLALLPVLVVMCHDPWDPSYLTTIVLTGLFVFVCGAAVTSLGLAMSTWCARLGRAVALTVTIYVLVTVGWLFLETWIGGRGEQGLMMGSPFFFAGQLAADICNPSRSAEHVGWGLFWIVFYGLAALGLLKSTLATFNRCLGRIEGGHPLGRRVMPWDRQYKKPRGYPGDRFE